jgi:hypothetical protein
LHEPQIKKLKREELTAKARDFFSKIITSLKAGAKL